MPSPDVTSKENVTIDSAGLASIARSAVKKSRSKSIGPGGLDALKEGSGNRREAAAATFVKSILKPTVPLSPPKHIPPHSSARKGPASPRKSPSRASPQKPDMGAQEGVLIDISDGTDGVSLPAVALPNPFGGASPKRGTAADFMSAQAEYLVAVRTEEEQQQAVRRREQQEKENDLVARKDARRKSLANRRVSFAPEATLHTWDVVELPEDSTTSSASGNSTRRASGLSTLATPSIPQPRSPLPSSDVTSPPSTPAAQPQAQVEESQVKASPAQQRDLYQKKRRRGSAIPPMNFNNPEEFSSSPYSGSSVASDDTGNQAVTADEIDSSDSDDKDLVEDESTVTGIDNDDVTAQSALSARSNGSSNSSGRLDEALRQAARQAGTQGIEYDEHGDITMEMADDQITNAFQPFMKQRDHVPQVVGNPSALQDQENVNPFSPAFRARVQAPQENDDAEQAMDSTQAAGSILSGNPSKPQASPEKSRRHSSVGGRRRSSGNRRRSSGASSTFEDETMDFTTAIGGIQQEHAALQPQVPAGSQTQDSDNDEELTMELTTVVGGVLAKVTNRQQDDQLRNRRESIESFANDTNMDITLAAGGILSSITERTEPPEDQTMEMDMTQAVGAILPKPVNGGERNRAKVLMEQESDAGQLSLDPFFDGPAKATPATVHTPSAAVFRPSGTRASETGSPSKTGSVGRGIPTAASAARQSLTPKFGSRQTTPLKKVSTPTKQVTPQAGLRPATPSKTPPAKNISLRKLSPKKLFENGLETAAASPKLSTRDSLFKSNDKHGVPAPQIVLKPRCRRSSGLGADKEGLGSPRVTELLDRRSSIGQSAQSFVSKGKDPAGVRFEDPRVMEQELEQERAEDQRRESGRGILQTEADPHDTDEQKDATASLKDMIESLTPQKKKAKARKSLHVGAAKGILGKRPAELDADEDEEDSALNRLNGREGSPVKKVKLPAPPSKNETTRRNLRSARLSLAETLGNPKMNTPSMGVSPLKGVPATTPQGQPRFKDAVDRLSPERPVVSFEKKLEAGKANTTEPAEPEDRIHLQDFLNMTSIRFMELTTTKRRLTVAPNPLENSITKTSADAERSEAEAQLESSVVAGACTVPMLELYQHSCRELKRYIAEGRSIVKEIEGDTYEENPALFREYMTAPPNVKAVMDNQFKNVKTHARLLSKAMWYEWRMKLLDGLKEGLVQISDGMDEDANTLSQQERLIEQVLPPLLEQNSRLQDEREVLQAQADELASCDQDELREARENLNTLNDDLQIKQRLLGDLKKNLEAKVQGIQDAVERRDEYHAEIREAERVRQESRGWKISEVAVLQENVTALEEAYGWKIISAAGSALTMTYKDALQLYFTPSSFIAPGSSTPIVADDSAISLTYIADAHEHHPRPLTTEKRFFLQIIRAQLQCLQQSQVRTSDLLNFITRNWEAALTIAEEVRSLGTAYITEATIVSDEVMAVEAILLLQQMQTKLAISFQVQARGGEGENGMEGLEVAVSSKAKVVYGEDLKENKMAEWLDGKLGEDQGVGAWGRVVGKLEEKLKARARKG
ncbi:MAG: hypothetical protein Q9208_007465 [Pyrenodesmia sp. 3 TL-2023]